MFWLLPASGTDILILTSFLLFAHSKERFYRWRKKQLRNFLRLHHWNYAKACIIYGVFRTATMPDFMEFPSLEQEMLAIGTDLLFLYEVLSRGNVYFSARKNLDTRRKVLLFALQRNVYVNKEEGT